MLYLLADLKDNEDRPVTVINPWRRTSQEDNSGGHISDDITSELGALELANSDTWSISWDDICNMFDTLFLIWNPRLFQHILAHHR